MTTESNSRSSDPLSSGQPVSRLMQLDVLRGIAILLVLFRHAAIKPDEAGFLAPLANFLYGFGWIGVDLFFVLSGFLVGGLLLGELKQRKCINVKRFLIRRTLKIWPLYYVFLVFKALWLVKHHQYGDLKSLMPNLLHIQNYVGTISIHTWTLAIEEHFYIALPILLLFLSRSRRFTVERIPVIAFSLVVACNLLRWGSRHFDYSFGFIYVSPFVFTHMSPTHLRIDGLFWGVLLAYIYHYRPDIVASYARLWQVGLCVGVLLISPMFFLPPSHIFVFTVGFTLLYIGFGLIVASALCIKSPVKGWKYLLGQSLARIGVFSYAIYLWHAEFATFTVSFYFHKIFFHLLPPEVYWVTGMATYFLIAFLVGMFFSKIIEQPALAVRNRFYPAG